MGHYKDMTGEKYGRLTVLEYAGNRQELTGSSNRDAMWRCRCDCGKVIVTGRSNLITGNTVSCGCYNREINLKRLITHGESKSRLYKCWEAIIQRTLNPKNVSYKKHYGSKGITVCDEWRKYENFAKWAKENGYRDDLTIDRIDPTKGYEPSNCRWATYKEQNNHLSRNHYITLWGRTQTMKQWADELGYSYGTIVSRICRYGWPPEKAFTTPTKGMMQNVG